MKALLLRVDEGATLDVSLGMHQSDDNSLTALLTKKRGIKVL